MFEIALFIQTEDVSVDDIPVASIDLPVALRVNGKDDLHVLISFIHLIQVTTLSPLKPRLNVRF